MSSPLQDNQYRIATPLADSLRCLPSVHPPWEFYFGTSSIFFSSSLPNSVYVLGPTNLWTGHCLPTSNPSHSSLFLTQMLLLYRNVNLVISLFKTLNNPPPLTIPAYFSTWVPLLFNVPAVLTASKTPWLQSFLSSFEDFTPPSSAWNALSKCLMH